MDEIITQQAMSVLYVYFIFKLCFQRTSNSKEVCQVLAV